MLRSLLAAALVAQTAAQTSVTGLQASVSENGANYMLQQFIPIIEVGATRDILQFSC
jgi:hypothetical protein